ncbi:MAG: Gfo/Idh/MocA family oxidoreductase [Betaproteobacteria bacterium]|jgi:predicted dehydrogenase
MIHLALYGLGNWGLKLIKAVNHSSEKIKFITAITRNPEAHRQVADQFNLALSSRYEDALTDPKIDAVLIATPHSMHFSHIMQALAAGKHVFAEKPLTLTAASARTVVQTSEKAGLTLGLGFNRRYAPAIVKMRECILAGEIGQLLHIDAHHSGPNALQLKPGQWRSDRSESPAGSLTPRGIHTLDAMISMAGPVSEVYAYSDCKVLPAALNMDDTTSMLMRFKNGVTGYFSTISVTAESWKIHAMGSAGRLELMSENEVVKYDLSSNRQVFNFPAVDKERAELEAFADAVNAKVAFMIDPVQAVNGVALIEAIVQSASSGKPVQFN